MCFISPGSRVSRASQIWSMRSGMEYPWDRSYVVLAHVNKYIIKCMVVDKICTRQVQPLKGEGTCYKFMQNPLLE